MPPAQGDSSGVGTAIERYRDLAKYLVTIFAAIGGLLVAGTQLSSIGALTWEQNCDRIVAGGVGFIIGIGSVVWIIWSVLSVLGPVEVTLDEIVENDDMSAAINERQELLGPFSSVAELRDVLLGDLLSGEQRVELKGVAESIVDHAGFDRVKALFEAARIKMLVGAVLGTIGIVAFAWAANPPKSETADPIVRPLPVEVSLRLTAEGRDLLSDAIGRDCKGEISALSIGGTEDMPRIVTLPLNGCKPAQFSVPSDWGTVSSTRAAPSQEVEKKDEGQG